jgi:cell division protein FtsQ
MIKRITIQRVLFFLFWAGVATGMGFLLKTAWNKKDRAVCKGFDMVRNDGDSFVFVKPTQLEGAIRQRAGGKIVGQLIDRFPLQRIEDTLKKFIGVSDAQAFFDNRSNLHVRIQERIPVARIFTQNGISCYLDSAGVVLPLSDQVVVDCPVFNGVHWKAGKPDSVQAKKIVLLARYIQADSFWTAQVGHFDIDDKGLFELVPVAGNHRVQFGKAEDPAASFRRLWIFYQQVLGAQGLDRYARIDVRYQGQVVASRNRNRAVADSAQLRKQVEVLIRSGMNDSTNTKNKPIKRAT